MEVSAAFMPATIMMLAAQNLQSEKVAIYIDPSMSDNPFAPHLVVRLNYIYAFLWMGMNE